MRFSETFQCLVFTICYPGHSLCNDSNLCVLPKGSMSCSEACTYKTVGKPTYRLWIQLVWIPWMMAFKSRLMRSCPVSHHNCLINHERKQPTFVCFQVLDEVRPYLVADGGNVRVMGVDTETRVVSLASRVDQVLRPAPVVGTQTCSQGCSLLCFMSPGRAEGCWSAQA